ncbi:MAG: DUF3060 domain-containing protein [Alphaproteobacteria bacterium]|nr:DUF3060 domain-containing protein [Alphaproteobacteria bacterium]
MTRLPLLLAALLATSAAFAGKIKVGGLEVDVDDAPDVEVTETSVQVDTKASVLPADQCTLKVPADAKVIKADTELNGAGGSFLVCAGAEVEVNGTEITLYVAQPAEIELNGANNTVWAKGASELEVTGTGNRVVSEKSAELELVGVNNTLQRCEALTLDTSAVKGGC